MGHPSRLAAVVSAAALAGVFGLAAAQTISDDAINQAAERGSQQSSPPSRPVTAAVRNPGQLEVDNGNKTQADRAAARAQRGMTADSTRAPAELPPKADRN